MHPGLSGVDALEIVVKYGQRILRSQHLGVIGPQRVDAGGDDIRRRIGAGGQLVVEVIAAVCRDAHGVPLLGLAGLCLELRPAKSEKCRQHHDHAQRNGRRLCAQRRRKALFKARQLLLQGCQVHRFLCGCGFAVTARVKSAGSLILFLRKICVRHFSFESPSSCV